MRRLVLALVISVLLLAFAIPAFAQGDGAVIHVVQPGENLYRISLRYNVSLSQLASVNNIANVNLIFAGQRLIVPQPGVGPAPTQPPPAEPEPSDPPPATSTYTVQHGDTLGRIASRFGTTISAIAAANGITNVNLIFPGQVLTIPGGTGVPAPPPSGQPAPPPPSGNIGGFELGGHVEGFQYTANMRESGMTWVKKQLVWTQGQPASIAQGLIDQANSNGFQILLGIVGDPGQLGANRAQYIQDYAAFVGGVAGLMTQGGAIEVWNEPNIDRQWPNGQISGAAYTEMLRAAYAAIKNTNPNVLVVSGAPAPTGASIPGAVVPDDAFISGMASAGAANYMDCVGIHYNEGILPPTAVSGDPRGNSGHYSRYYPRMVSLYAGAFPGKPLCFTEIGYLSPEGFSQPLSPLFSWAQNTTVADQATWLGEAVRLARQSGRIRLFIVWNVDFTRYDDDPQAGYAIIRPDGSCPACATLAAAMR